MAEKHVCRCCLAEAGLELGVVAAALLLPDAVLPPPDDGDDDSYWIETNGVVIVHLNDGVYV